MCNQSEAVRLSMAALLRQIVQNNPPITDLNMHAFSDRTNWNENIGELVFEILLNSSIDTVTVLNLSNNSSWFVNSRTRGKKLGNADLLVELISK